MKALYFDCFSGISGDMALGALIDLGVDAQRLVEALNTLSVGGWSLTVERVVRRGISASFARVRLDGEAGQPHGHGHEQGDREHDHGDHS
ncbi:MAG: LarC family nickel insertion protein, partial [Clostridiales bacterium]|nr:LarC family nickel insertion protein [Clostridiales bacterium]